MNFSLFFAAKSIFSRKGYRFLTAALLIASATLPPTFAMAEEEETAYQEIEWVQLMPEDDLQALLNPPDMIGEILDGSAQDSIASMQAMPNLPEDTQQYYSALQSTRVMSEFDGKQIRVPGFIVPLDFTEDQMITEFFLVPYFGACLHMPPPPPNQIIYGKFPSGLQVETLDTPFWLEGKVVIETNENELGVSAYSMEVHQAFVYEE